MHAQLGPLRRVNRVLRLIKRRVITLLRVIVHNQVDRSLIVLFPEPCEILGSFLLRRYKFKQRCFLLLKPELIALIHHLFPQFFILNFIVLSTELKRVLDVTPQVMPLS